MKFVIKGRPVTAKNGATMVTNGRHRFLVKKPALKRWESSALIQIAEQALDNRPSGIRINEPVNLKITVWPYIDGRCDLVGYIQAVQDVMVKAGILADDSAWKPRIVVSLDGSSVAGIDKVDPRVEIEVTEL